MSMEKGFAEGVRSVMDEGYLLRLEDLLDRLEAVVKAVEGTWGEDAQKAKEAAERHVRTRAAVLQGMVPDHAVPVAD